MNAYVAEHIARGLIEATGRIRKGAGFFPSGWRVTDAGRAML